ncbi:Mss4-like protein [Rhodotorula diobovata]|uniref:Mss4-like protein n=1 Tax=Rhodotorula diobovata TaxID=5288 RepID=A0A5C5G627_9BASI|nr:Mss4-like protein [Rhodotorula diobovata]
MDCEYALVQSADIPRALELEQAGFPEDEAASLDSLQSRQANAGDLFLGAYTRTSSERRLVGYVCSTRTASSTLTHDSMATHDPSGPYVAIHSVCVDEAHRGKGVAANLLSEYLARLDKDDSVRGARLISHDELIKLYQRAGFELVGRSAVVHGARPWYELKVDFPRASSSSSSSSSSVAAAPAAAIDHEAEEGDFRSPGRLLARAGGLDSLVDTATGTNAADLFCPRAECRCLLLRRGAGNWVRGHAGGFELPALPRPVSAPAPTAGPSQGYWSVSSPLAFENIGFSRNALPPSSSASASSAAAAPPAAQAGATIKYLTCADCDHGPLGWHDTEGRDLGAEVQAENDARGGAAEGTGLGAGVGGEVRKGREFLLAVERVRYRV